MARFSGKYWVLIHPDGSRSELAPSLYELICLFCDYAPSNARGGIYGLNYYLKRGAKVRRVKVDIKIQGKPLTSNQVKNASYFLEQCEDKYREADWELSNTDFWEWKEEHQKRKKELIKDCKDNSGGVLRFKTQADKNLRSFFKQWIFKDHPVPENERGEEWFAGDGRDYYMFLVAHGLRG